MGLQGTNKLTQPVFEPTNEAEEYAASRGIDTAIAREVGLFIDGDWLGIPVKDCQGLHKFNKYRRLRGEGDKYKYEKGSKMSLYGAEQAPGRLVFLCFGS